MRLIPTSMALATIALLAIAPLPANEEPRVRLGWRELSGQGTTRPVVLEVSDAPTTALEPDTLNLLVSWPAGALTLDGAITPAIPEAIASDYQVFADPVKNPPQGTTQWRITVFRVDLKRRNLTTGDGIATFPFAIPPQSVTVTLEPDPSGGVFNGENQLDDRAIFDTLTVRDAASPTPTPVPSPTPALPTRSDVARSILRTRQAAADLNTDGATDAADTILARPD